MSKREWNTVEREPWNPVIHQLLRAIDNHNTAYFKTGNSWHLHKAQFLREYVIELKDFILESESENTWRL
jgi:hypothetical protein